jgi:hypothetical protein
MPSNNTASSPLSFNPDLTAVAMPSPCIYLSWTTAIFASGPAVLATQSHTTEACTTSVPTVQKTSL